MSLTSKQQNAFWLIGLVGGCAFLLVACGVQLGALGPDIDIVQSDGTIGYYTPNRCASPTVLAKSKQRHERIVSFVQNPGGRLPQEIAQNSFVNKLIAQSHYASSRALQAALFLSKESTAAPAADKPLPEITPSEFFEFGKLAVQFMHRVTAAPDSDAAVQRALQNLKLYYAIYFQGKFQTYLGAPLAAPSVSGSSTSTGITIGGSSTISDDQIVPAVQVFIEYLFDEILQSTVWVTYGSNNQISNYYPGGSTTTQPTYLLVNSDLAGQIEQKIGAGPSGCGMNVFKINLMMSLVNQSATIAAGETGLLVKSAGGIEVGLGVLGKLNIGDNNLVSELAKNVATVVASRLTVLFTAPIFAAIDFQKQSPPIAMAANQLAGKISRSGKVTGTSRAALVSAKNLQVLTAPLR